ncbi:MAG: hypothetical protein GTO62_11970, partial [Planctomycetales bacterium]|nr:hypothetical protein [Planctomycetales bacterium]
DQVSYEILGYRLQDNIYVEIQPNEEGWRYSEVNQVWLGVTTTKNRFFVLDGRTNEPILSAEQRAKVEATRAETEATRAETEAARAKAEAMARQEAEARAAELEAR